MDDKEIIKNLFRTINIKEEQITSLLRRLPFKELSDKEQDRVIMAEVGESLK